MGNKHLVINTGVKHYLLFYAQIVLSQVKGGEEMDNQVKMAAALFMMLTPEQKDAMLNLVENLLLEQEQHPSVEE